MEVAALFSLYFIITFQLTFQNLLTRNGHGPPELKDYEHEDNNDRLYRHYQAIVPTYKLNLSCCGNIIEWGLDVFDDKSSYALDLQVWRPSPTVDDSTGTGCYSLVGNNMFTSISLHHGLALVTPSPQDYIQFQPGDVLGFYVKEAKSTSFLTPGVVLRTNPSYLTSEIIWFASLNHEAATSQSGDCPYSVGSGGVLNTLTRAAPVISISITSVPCSPLPTVGLITQSTAFVEFHTSSINTELLPSPSNAIIPKKKISNTGLIVVTVMALLVATVFFIVVSLAIIIRLKYSRVNRQTHENTTAVNPAYGVTITLQDTCTHTPGEKVYDYPAINTHINNETRMNGVVYEAIADREGACSHSVAEPQGGIGDNIEAKQNEAYAVIADVVMEKNEAYESAIVY